jgi:membrane-associated phospholipid phosphatase
MSRLDSTEARALVRLQRLAGRPPFTQAAHVLSSAGEHAWVWLALSGAGCALDRPRRRQWAEVGVAAVVAHGSAVVLKRVVRRPRPTAPGIRVLDATPSRLSFPSAHASSTTAATIAAAPLLAAVPGGAALLTTTAAAMATARLLLGVHYPSDVSAGALLGFASARIVRRSIGGSSR